MIAVFQYTSYAGNIEFIKVCRIIFTPIHYQHIRFWFTDQEKKNKSYRTVSE